MEHVHLVKKLSNQEVMDLLITETNRYARQRNDHQFTQKTDLFKFLGILFLTGYHSLPREDLCWSKEEDVNVPLVEKVMSRFKFRQIKYLHAANNETLNKTTRFGNLICFCKQPTKACCSSVYLQRSSV
ncbi:piggyBac transposable element-derived protein 3-like [Ixodes scapularis]|uniref:piggyBac transposable element-derived protein 3-like n=1 Tax=Ixodes scapularis TaxID=6945 RepID=UPI001C38CCC9|nr:piggyBac transposable element-derived protein 3-like [Ixodes scapularis]